MRFDDLFDLDAFPWPFGTGTPPWQRRQRPRRTRWKWFERGDLKFAILGLIEEKPMHGYEVMQALEAQSAGCYKASPGSVYPTLQLLEDQGLLSSRDHGGKKIYSITDEGRAYLDENRDHVNRIFERVSRFSDRHLRPRHGRAVAKVLPPWRGPPSRARSDGSKTSSSSRT